MILAFFKSPSFFFNRRRGSGLSLTPTLSTCPPAQPWDWDGSRPPRRTARKWLHKCILGDHGHNYCYVVLLMVKGPSKMPDSGEDVSNDASFFLWGRWVGRVLSEGCFCTGGSDGLGQGLPFRGPPPKLEPRFFFLELCARKLTVLSYFFC